MSVLLDIDSSVLVILVASLAIDLIIGEWPAKIHPTVWIGNIISTISKPLPRTGSKSFIYGLILAICLPMTILISTWLLLAYLKNVNQWIYILVSIYFLKSSFSLRLLGSYRRVGKAWGVGMGFYQSTPPTVVPYRHRGDRCLFG